LIEVVFFFLSVSRLYIQCLCVQLQYSCEQHLTVLAAMHDVGDSLSKCLTLIAKLNDFEKLSKVSSF